MLRATRRTDGLMANDGHDRLAGLPGPARASRRQTHAVVGGWSGLAEPTSSRGSHNREQCRLAACPHVSDAADAQPLQWRHGSRNGQLGQASGDGAG